MSKQKGAKDLEGHKLLIMVKPKGGFAYIPIQFEITFNKHALLLQFERKKKISVLNVNQDLNQQLRLVVDPQKRRK